MAEGLQDSAVARALLSASDAIRVLLDTAGDAPPAETVPNYEIARRQVAAASRLKILHDLTEGERAALEGLLEQLGLLRKRLVGNTGAGFSDLAAIYDQKLELNLVTWAARFQIAALIRARRDDLGLTLDKLGTEVNRTASLVSQIETARTLPGKDRSAEFDRALGLVGQKLSVSSVLDSLMDRRSDINRHADFIRQRRESMPSVNGDLRFGTSSATRTVAQLQADDPELRSAVEALDSLPRSVRESAISLLDGLRWLMPVPAPPTRRFDVQAIYDAQIDTPPEHWELPTLLIEVQELFDPFTTKSAKRRSDRFETAIRELSRRRFDASALVRGPVLRRAGRLVADRAHLDWRESGSLAQLEGLTVSLTKWIADRREKEPSSVARTLWSYWSELALADALAMPAPVADYVPKSMTLDPILDWFVSKCWEGSLRRWSVAALEYEHGRQRGDIVPPEPWASAIALWKVDPKQLGEELRRRRRPDAGHTEPEPGLEAAAANMCRSVYEAYVKGNPEAKALATRVGELFPAIPIVHNNLGFLLLAAGQYPEALQALERAAGLQYEDRYILDFNLGTAYYMLKRYEEALARFQACLAHLTSRVAVLFAIDGDRLLQVEVTSPRTYAALVALNGAAAATCLELRASVVEFVHIARSFLSLEVGAPPTLDSILTRLENQRRASLARGSGRAPLRKVRARAGRSTPSSTRR